MKKGYIESLLILIGLLFLGIAWYFVSFDDNEEIEKSLGIIGGLLAGYFFVYKLLTGWLFINLSISIEPERKPADSEWHHLAVKIVLKKGATDSVWLKDIQIRVSEMVHDPGKQSSYTPIEIIRPIGTKRLQYNNGIRWSAYDNKRDLVISQEEETQFAALTKVRSNAIIGLEVIVLGTRPFYAIEKLRRDLIQWKASAIVLPDA